MSFHSYTLQPYNICKQSGFGKFRPPDENDTNVKLKVVGDILDIVDDQNIIDIEEENNFNKIWEVNVK